MSSQGWSGWPRTSAGPGTAGAGTCSPGPTRTPGRASGGDPVAMLGLTSQRRLAELAADRPSCAALDEAERELDAYLGEPRWFQAQRVAAGSPLRHVAYFSPEFGISEALPQYSGGLGVLAGDHLKAASDLGVPLVGIGLFYRHGYFRQALSVDGWQQERYPDLDPWSMALRLCEPTVERRPGRRADRGPDLAGRGGPGAALPARHRRRGQPAAPAHDHRPALRRRDRAPPAPGDPARRGRRAGAAGPRRRDPAVPHQRGPRRLPRPRADPRADRRGRAQLPRGDRGGPRRLPLHHPHAGAGRHRPLPPRAHRAVLLGLGGRVRRLPRRPDGARPPPGRRPRRAVQHGGHGPAPGRPLQRRVEPARRGQPGHVRGPVAGRARAGGADRLGHQRRARQHLGVGRDRRAAPQARRAGLGRGGARGVGGRHVAAGRGRLAGPRPGHRAADRLRAGPPGPQRGRAGDLGVGRRLDAQRASTPAH